MREKSKFKKLIIPGAALIFSALLFVLFFDFSGSEAGEKYEVIFMGDSTVRGVTEEKNLSEVFSELYGKTCVNFALGGTTLSFNSAEKLNPIYSVCGDALLTGILSRDFSALKKTEVRVPGTEYFKDTISLLENTDFSAADYLVIGYGVNDIGAGIPASTTEIGLDLYSYAGSLKWIIQNINSRYPNLKIIFITPMHVWYNDIDYTYSEDYLAEEEIEYVRVLKEIAAEYGCGVADLFEETKNAPDPTYYTNDGMHPNRRCQILMCEKIYECMEELR